MHRTSTPRMFKNIFINALFILIVITLSFSKSYAQTKNFATVTPSSGVSSSTEGSVTNPANAAIPNSSSPAVLKSNYGALLLVGFAGESYIQLKYNSTVTAGKVTYIPFDAPVIGGVNVDLLALVGDLTGLLRNNYVQFEAYSGATASTDGTLLSADKVSAQIVKDAAGKSYFAVTVKDTYNSVRLKLKTSLNLLSLSLGGSISLNVYTAFNLTADNCGLAFASNLGDAGGVNVSLTDLVTNPQNSIDGNLNTSSQIQAGVVSLASTVSQTILFSDVSTQGDVVKVVLSQPGTILSIDALSAISVQAFKGDVPVGAPLSANNLLNIQLLSALSNSNKFAVFFTPTDNFDRVKISVSKLLNVGANLLAGGVNVHEVQRTVTKPVFGGTIDGTMSVCGGSNLTLAPTTVNSAFTYNYYEKVNNVRTLLANGTVSGPYAITAPTVGVHTYYISAQKTGCAAESDLDSVVVTVRPVLLLTATTLSNAIVGTTYSKQINPATSGTGPYTYALAAASTLPAGLVLSPAGLITGLPTTAGTFNFDITATDNTGCKVTATYTLIVKAKLVLVAADLPKGTVGVAYPSTLLPVPTGGSTPYTYAATNLPANLILNASTGAITGTPSVSGTFTFPVTITDADGNTVTTNFTIIVRDPMALPAATLAGGTTGVVYPTQTLPAATGGSGVYTYTASGLPAGLVFNTATREITGTPTQAGTYTVTLNAADNEGKTASATYTLVVKDPLVLPAKVLANGIVGTTYPGEIIPAATGGTGVYTYTATNLPPGLTFNTSTRAISGIPTQSGTFTLQVTVTDNSNTALTVPYVIKVVGALDLPSAVLPNGTVGTSYTSPALPAVTGGTSPYTYSVSTLPAGLTFNAATRVISGTPTAGGNFAVTMTVTDRDGLSTSTDYALVINVSAPVVAGATICSGSPAALTVTNTTTGVNYRFYGASGNTVLFTGSTYNTGALTSSTTYYVEAFSGTAVSARTQVNVVVNPTPALPTVLTNNVTISSGQTVVLQAASTDGATINWYESATGGASVFTGPNYTTPAITATKTYYAETSNSFGCVSASRVPAVITVLAGTTNPNCNSANSQQSGVSSILCVACGIQNPGNSIDADPDNFTQINLAVGVGASGYQRLIFQRPGVATDSIRLDLETPTGLLDLTALGGITVSVYNGTTLVRTTALNSSLLSLRLLGGERFKATILAGGIYDRVEVRLSPVVAALTNLNIYGAEVIFPNPVLPSLTQTICSGTTATFTAAPAGGTTLTWYSAATGGSIVGDQNTFTTPALTATTTYYIGVSKNGCENPARVPVTVTVIPAVATPVVAASSPVCAGSPAVLTVDNPQTGITYKWYADETGGTALATGTTFTVSGLTANTTYYLEASNGNCTATARTAATIIVNPLPPVPQVQASASNVNPGQSVRLTASPAQAGVEFRWFTSATSTVPVFTGENYVTPPLNTTTTYYVAAAFTATGCESSRVQTTITVNGNGTPIPVECEVPVSQTNGISGTLAILASVDNPGLAIDADQQTGSTLSIPIGIGASAFQKVSFTGLSNVGDTVRIRLTSPSQLLSLSLLGNITLTTYNGTASNNDGLAVNNQAINLQLLNGGTSAIINFLPAAKFDGVEVRLNSGLVGALNAVNFNYARRIIKAPVLTAASFSACPGATTQLSVVQEDNVLYNWYNAAGDLLGTGATFTTPVITANTQFFVEATRGDCGGSRTAVNVTLTPAPAVPQLLSATTTTCQNSDLVLNVQNPQEGVTYQWYKDNVPLAGQTADSLIITNIQADATYSVEAINICNTVSAKASVAVTVGTLAAPVVTPSSLAVNAGERLVIVASSPTSGLTYKWYTVDPANPGAPVISDATNGENGVFTTPVITTATTFYVVAENTAVGCQSAAASVTITINVPGPGEVPCEGASSQTVSTGGLVQVLAGVANPNFAVDQLTETSSSLFIPVGVGSFVAQKVNFIGASQAGDRVKIRISSAAGLLSLAVAPSITITPYNGSVAGTPIMLSNPLINLQILNGGQSAEFEFTPTSTFDAVELRLTSGLVGALTSINFNYAQRILAPPPVAAANVTICEGSPATLEILNPIVGINYKWYLGADLVAENTSTFTTPTTLTGGNHIYTVTATRGTCVSLVGTDITVTVTPAALAPVAANDNPESTCLNTPVVLNVNQVTGVSYNWYNALTGGTLLAANTSSFTTPANLPVGTTDYYVEAVNSNSCANLTGRTKISIIVNPAALAEDITVSGAENVFCTGNLPVLTATSTVANPIFNWYTDAALTNLVYTGVTYNAPAITVATTYYVTVSGINKCENTPATAKAVILSVNPPAVAADIAISGVPDKLCPGTPVTLEATTTTVDNPVFKWYTDAALTNKVFEGPSFIVPTIASSLNYYVTVEGTNKCQNSSANAKVVMLIVTPPSAPGDTNTNGNPASVCAGSKAILKVSSSTVVNPIFTWYRDAALTDIAFTGAEYETDPLLVATTFYVTVSGDNKCEGPATSITVNIKPLATAADLAVGTPPANICAGETVSLTATSSTITNPIFTWYTDAALTTAVGNGSPFNLVNLAPGTYTYYVTVSSADVCESLPADAKSVTFTIKPRAGAADLTAGPAPVNLCAGATATLTATSTIANPIFTWYTDAALTTPAGNGSPFAISNLAAGTYTYYVTVSSASVCESLPADAKSVTFTINPRAGAADLAVGAAPANLCAGATATLTVTSSIANPVFTWYTDAALTTPAGNGSPFAISNLAAGTYTYYVTVSGTNVCESLPADAKSVTFTINPRAGAADLAVGAAPANLCAGATATLTATSTTIANPVFTWYSDAALTTPVGNGSPFAISNLAAGTYTYYVSVSGTNVCESLPADAKSVTFTINPRAGAADLAVGAAPANLCAGAVVSLTATSTTIANPVFTWYSDAALTTPVGNGSPFAISNLAAGTYTYYVTVSGTNVCESLPADAKSVTFTINPRAGAADLAVGAAPANLCAGATATLTATSPTIANPVFTWYSDAALTTPVGNGSPFAISNLAAGTYTYYVTVSGTNVCESLPADAKSVTFTINPRAGAADLAVGAAPANLCAGATATLTATSTTIANPVFTWYSDAALTTPVGNGSPFAISNLAAGTYTYYVTVSGTNVCESLPADAKSVTFTINPRAGAADLAVGAAPANLCAGATATLTATSTTIANPVFTWYSDAALTTPVGSGSPFAISNLAAGTYTYYVTVSGTNVCESLPADAKSVTFTINPRAGAADLAVGAAPANLCAGVTATLTATSPTLTNPIFTWYSDAALTTPVGNGSPFAISNLAAGTYTYYVTVSGTNVCESLPADAKSVTFTINPRAGAADLAVGAAPANLCAGATAMLTATSPTIANPVFTWYTDAALTTPVGNGSPFAISNLAAGTYTYYVSVSGTNVCESLPADAKSVTFTINPRAGAADLAVGAAPANLCAGATATLTATSTTIANPVFTWYSDAALTTPVGNGSPFAISNLAAGNYTYYVSVSGTNVCESLPADAKSVTFTINPRAGAADLAVGAAPANLCAGATATLTATSPTITNPIFTWYSDAALTTPVGNGSPFAISNLAAGTYTYYVSVSGTNVCESLPADAKSVTFTINPRAGAADLAVGAAPANICAGATATLTATSPTIANPIFTWYSDAALTAPIGNGSPFNIAGLTPGNYTYYVTVSGTNVCESLPADAKSVTFTIKPAATAADITVGGLPSKICAGTAVTLVASSTTVTNPVFTWYSDAALTTAVYTGTSFNVPSFTTTTTYYITVSGDDKCENTAGTAKAVTLTITPPAVASDVIVSGVPANLCAGTAVTLVASSTTVTNPVFTWYDDSALNNAVFTGTTFNVPALTATRTYYVTVSGDNKCENTAATARVVTLNVKPAAVASDITVGGIPTNICAGTPVTLTASTTTVTNPIFTWYTDAALTNAAFTGAIFNVPALTATRTYYVTVSGDNKCENADGNARVVTIVVKPAAVAADIIVGGIPSSICYGTGAVLMASSPNITNPVFTWYTNAALTDAVYTGDTFSIPSLNASITYYVTVEGSNKCSNTSGNARVVALVVNPALVFNGGSLNNAATGANYSVQINPATGGSPAYSYTLEPGSNLPAGLSLSATGVISGRATTPGNYSFTIIAIDSKNCTANADFTIGVNTITMTLPPAVLPDGIVGSVYVSQTLPAAVGGTGPLTYMASGSPPGLTFNPQNREITGTPTMGGTFTVIVTVTDANGLTATQSYTIVIRVPAPVIAGLESCSGSSAILTIPEPVNGVTYNWYADATGGSVLFTGTSFETAVITATTTYYVEGTSGTAKSDRVAVVVTVASPLSSPLVSVQESTMSTILFTWTMVRGATAYEVSINGGVNWITPTSGSTGDSHLVSGLQSNATVTLLVRAKGDSDCQTSAPATVTGTATDGREPVSAEIYIPNTFTPNGDGKNDVFYIYGASISTLKFRIFNQWGEYIYETQSMQNGWDGNYRGKMQPNGVYVYYAVIVTTDGTQLLRKGTVTLIR